MKFPSLIVFVSLVLPTTIHAQDVSSGQEIAQRWCSGCHRINSEPQKSINDAIPSFPAIAALKSTTAMSLAAFLSTSHGPMPDYSLSRTEIRDVSSYILSQRK
jgi:mono/diheme cytochrome c family protein